MGIIKKVGAVYAAIICGSVITTVSIMGAGFDSGESEASAIEAISTVESVEEENSRIAWLEIPEIEKYVLVGEYRGLQATTKKHIVSDEEVEVALADRIENSGEKAPAEIDDEWVTEHTDYNTLSELREAVRDSLQRSFDAKEESDLEDMLFSLVLEDSEILSYPEKRYREIANEFRSSVERYAESNDLTFSEYLSKLGYSEEEFGRREEEYTKEILEREMVLQAICEKEGLRIGDEIFEKYLDDLVQLLGVKDKETLIRVYGEDEVNEIVVWNEVTDLLKQNAQIEDKLK